MGSLNTSIECVLFDLDGTLIDTAEDFQKVLDIMLDQSGRARVSSAEVHQTVSDGARGLVKLAFQFDESHPEFGQRHQQLLDLYYEQLENTKAKPYPGIMELLGSLEAANIQWGIVTNKPEKYSRLLLSKLDLLQRCPVLICPEHVSAGKPNPEALLLACEKLGCEIERTVYIGDHIRDMQAAKNADIIAIAARYGYLKDDAKVDEWNADFIIESPADTESLLSILKFA
jgi:2-phosphoglycolate phosphatase